MTATDVDGLTDTTYFSVTTGPTVGGASANINAETGAWTYTPTNADWFGSDTFTVTVTDDEGGTTIQVVNITLANIDDPATIGGDISFSGNEGDSPSGTMTASDVEGLTDTTYFSVATGPTVGGATANIDAETGAWTYTPVNADWFGSDTFTVTVTDDLGGTTTQVVSITLANVDDPATVGGDISFSGNEGDSPSGTMTASDVDGLTDTTYFSVTTGPTVGGATANIDAETGAWAYTPANADWYGSDTFTVTVTDDQGGTATQVVSITLANVDDPAIIGGDIAYAGNEGDAVSGTLTATDADGLTDGTYFSVTAPAANGTAAINAATGTWTFTPTDPNWFGSDTFTVTVTDDLGATTTQVVNVTLTNVDDSATIGGDIAYAGNEGDTASGTMTATDVEGLTDGSYFSVTSPATNGTATINAATGAWTFTPTDPNWIGSDAFTVTVTDDLGGTTTQVVSITLANVDDDPAIIGGDIAYAGNEGDTVSGTLTATDVEGLTDGSYFTVTTAATNGTATINASTGAWDFTPSDPDWFGSDTFTVTVTDDLGGTSTQVINLVLANVDDAATISGTVSFSGTPGASIAGNLNATDIEGLTDGTYFSITTAATQGTATIDPATGDWSFTPTEENWRGTDSFTVTVTDDLGGSTTQVVSVTVAAPNLPTRTIPETPAPISKSGNQPDETQSDDGGGAGEVLPEETLPEDVYNIPQIRTAETPDESGSGSSLFDDEETSVQPPQQSDVKAGEKPERVNADNILFTDDEELDEQFENEFVNQVQKIQSNIEWDENAYKVENIEVKIFLGTSMSLTAGIVSWVLRGGSLLASLISTVPLLKPFDPLPILAKKSDEEDVEEDRTEITNPNAGNSRRVENMFDPDKAGPE